MGWLKDQTWITPSGKVVKRFAVKCIRRATKRSPAIYGLYDLKRNIPVLDYVGAIPRSEMMMLLNSTGYRDYMFWCAWVWRDAPPGWNPFESKFDGFTPPPREWHWWCSLKYLRG
jgi:hypothetical protein